jgi:hypothetical protein
MEHCHVQAYHGKLLDRPYQCNAAQLHNCKNDPADRIASPCGGLTSNGVVLKYCLLLTDKCACERQSGAIGLNTSLTRGATTESLETAVREREKDCNKRSVSDCATKSWVLCEISSTSDPVHHSNTFHSSRSLPQPTHSANVLPDALQQEQLVLSVSRHLTPLCCSFLRLLLCCPIARLTWIIGHSSRSWLICPWS